MIINQNELRYSDYFRDNIFWDDKNLHILLLDKREVVIKNADLSAITYHFNVEGLPSGTTIVKNQKIWDNP